MIELHQFSGNWGLPSASPFCVKLELLFRMKNVPYTTVNQNDPGKGPKNKMPFIVHEGRTIGDSGLIIDHLTREGVLPPENLDPQQAARSLAITRLVEEHLYWAMVYFRWVDEENFKIISQTFFGGLPPLVRNIVPKIALRNITRMLQGHGLGRHTPVEIVKMATDDLNALAAELGDKPFFMGDTPGTLDATVYGLLINILDGPFKDPLKEVLKKHYNLTAYCERIKKTWFSSATERAA